MIEYVDICICIMPFDWNKPLLFPHGQSQQCDIVQSRLDIVNVHYHQLYVISESASIVNARIKMHLDN